jgi:hypothetical protein
MKITSPEHYESVYSLLDFMYTLKLLSAAAAFDEFVDSYEADWASCGDCGMVGHDNCECNPLDWDHDYWNEDQERDEIKPTT